MWMYNAISKWKKKLFGNDMFSFEVMVDNAIVNT